MKNITVIGAGTMGNGIAHTFAQKDFNVNLVDISAEALEKAMVTIEKKLDRLVSYIVANSLIMLNNVSWKWNDINGFKQRIQTMLDGEADNMGPD